MKWRANQNGDKRTRKVFLFMPCEHEGYWYWMQRVVLTEEFISNLYVTHWVVTKLEEL